MAGDWIDFAHTGPGTLAGSYLRTFWHPVYVADDLPPGSAKPVKFANEEFTLYRGEAGEPHVVAFRCAHRGTQLSLGWVEGDCIRCRYHGWKYDASGHAVEIPGQSNEAFAQKVRIRSYPTKEYLGLIFAYFGEGSAPELPRYLEFEGDGVVVGTTYKRACNYFNSLENGVDLLHVAFTHRDIPNYSALDVSSVSAEESEWGITVSATLPNGRARINQAGMPNIIHFKTPPDVPGIEWTDVLAWRVPIDDENHASFNARFVHVTGGQKELFREQRKKARAARPASPPNVSEAVLRGDIDMKALMDRKDLLNIQDDVTQIGQGRIPDRENERLSPSDVGVILLRKIYSRELRNLAEGRPLKQWPRRGNLTVTI
jgi:5,5'-dehydrodivanillate O-demethylase